jgi:hypothetical protein
MLNATQRNATQRNATQRNATQRNATQRNAIIRTACHCYNSSQAFFDKFFNNFNNFFCFGGLE